MTSDIDEALKKHRAGRLDDAEQDYRAILNADPSCAEAWHLLGVIALQRGEAEAAEPHRPAGPRPAGRREVPQQLRRGGRAPGQDARCRGAVFEDERIVAEVESWFISTVEETRDAMRRGHCGTS